MARRRGRDIDGIILLDKPTGVTSNRALRRVARLLDARKAGHTGSLDPLASGLLALCFGEATKVSGWLLDADKRYTAVARLGVTTDSADADGAVLERRPVPEIDAQRLESVLAAFRGPQQQVPPMFSALKHNGQRLHELARAGVEVDRPPRAVTINALDGGLIGDDRLQLAIDCSKGTYVRSLVADVGEALGCGAHVEALRRTRLGPFVEPEMVSLESLEAAGRDASAAGQGWLQPIDTALADRPAVSLDAAAASRFGHGQAVATERRDLGDDTLLRVYGPGGVLLGVATMGADGRAVPRRLLVQRHSGG
jgi:tRNA pseudouridine55 synthase